MKLQVFDRIAMEIEYDDKKLSLGRISRYPRLSLDWHGATIALPVPVPDQATVRFVDDRTSRILFLPMSLSELTRSNGLLLIEWRLIEAICDRIDELDLRGNK